MQRSKSVICCSGYLCGRACLWGKARVRRGWGWRGASGMVCGEGGGVGGRQPSSCGHVTSLQKCAQSCVPSRCCHLLGRKHTMYMVRVAILHIGNVEDCCGTDWWLTPSAPGLFFLGGGSSISNLDFHFAWSHSHHHHTSTPGMLILVSSLFGSTALLRKMSEELRLPDFFPLKHKKCTKQTDKFFACFTEKSEMKDPDVCACRGRFCQAFLFLLVLLDCSPSQK